MIKITFLNRLNQNEASPFYPNVLPELHWHCDKIELLLCSLDFVQVISLRAHDLFKLNNDIYL